MTNDATSFAQFVDDLERLGFDSLWLSERISGDAPDPLIALAFAAARTTKLKLGTSVLVVPGRNPVLLAQELATLDRLSHGRLLPAVGLGVADPHEQQAFGVERTARAKIMNEVVPLLRRFWTEDSVDHEGDFYRYSAVTVNPKPIQQPIEIWLGGIAPAEVRRVGRIGDGWLPSFCTAEDIATGIPAINQVAADGERSIDPEHFGAVIAYSNGPMPPAMAAFIAHRRPEIEPNTIVPDSLPALRIAIEKMITAGASKFVVLPVHEPSPAGWTVELEQVAEAIKPLEN